jgi:hypothetical protein
VHGLAVCAVLAGARHAPVLEHAVQVDAPAPLYVPTAHERPAAAMVEPAGTVCDGVTVYAPAPPLVPEMNAVMVVPAVTPTPESVAPTASTPDATAETVSVVPAMPPVTAAEPEPVGQKEPARQGVPAGDAAPAAHVVPALHGNDVAAVLPVAVQ